MSRILVFLVCLTFFHCSTQKKDQVADEYLTALEEVASAGGEFWVQVHAMEFLIDLGESQRVTDLLPAFALYESEAQKRVGYWRMKHRLAANSDEWLEKIRNAYTDTTGPDRIHAAETLAKLGFSIRNADKELPRRDTVVDGALKAFVKWGLVLPETSQQTPDYDLLLAMIEGSEPTERKIAAYACGFFDSMPESYAQRLVNAALREPDNSDAYAYLLLAAYIHGRNLSSDSLLVARFRALGEQKDKTSRISFCRGVAVSLDSQFKTHLELLFYIQDPLGEAGAEQTDPADQDVRAAAAYALRKLEMSET